MKQCLYASRARRPFTVDELDELLGKARERNHADGLTGLLVFGGGGFVQVVEGTPAAVDAVYARIQRDPRHEVLMHTSQPIAQRHFPEWQMGYLRLGAAAERAIHGFADIFEEGCDLDRIPGLDPLARDLIGQLRKAALVQLAPG